MLVVRQLVRNLVKSMVNFFSESDYSSKFLSVLGTPKYSVTFTLYYELMSFHVKINRHHYALHSVEITGILSHAFLAKIS